MTKKEALKILTEHQLWRRGSDEVPMATPKQLGEAIDVAIKQLGGKND